MLADGFFPLGFVDQCFTLPGTAAERCAKRLVDLDQIRSGGFNLMAAFFGYDPNDYACDMGFLDEAVRDNNHPVYVIDGLMWGTSIVATFREHPAMFGWYTYDDVDEHWAWLDNDPNDPNYCFDPNCLDPNTPNAPAAVNECNGEMKDADGGYNYTLIGGDLPQIFPAYDVCSNVDVMYCYWYRFNHLHVVHDSLTKMVAGLPHHPIIAGLRTFPRWNLPTPAEIRNMTYQAVVAGAAGILYYDFYEYCNGTLISDLADLNDPDVAALWNELTALAGEINGLNAERLRPLFSDLMFACDPNDIPGDVRWAYWICYDPNSIADSALYAIAVNVAEEPNNVYPAITDVQVALPVPCNSTGTRLDGGDPNDPWPLGPCSDSGAPAFHALPALGVYVYKFPLPILRGDLNCDGTVDRRDVVAFGQALNDAETWTTTYPDCAILNGDHNGDGLVNDDDIVPISPCKADMNCDGTLNMGDVNPLTQALSDPDAWQATYPGCSILNGDANDDGSHTVADTTAFADYLMRHSNETCP